MTTQLIDATVKYPAQAPREYDHGPRINVVCTLSDGTDEKLWGKPDDRIADLKKGQTVQLIRAGRSLKLAEQPSRSTEADANDLPAYAARLGQNTSQYEQAWQAASALLKRRLGQPAEALPYGPQLIQAIAAELFKHSLS